jgi:hypothetical protein
MRSGAAVSATATTARLAGAFLAEYDPEARGGRGEVWWIEDVCRAVSFLDLAGAVECYRAVPENRRVREDGKPNRPLTVFTVEFVDLPDPAPFMVNPARVRRVSRSRCGMSCGRQACKAGKAAEDSHSVAGPMRCGRWA